MGIILAGAFLSRSPHDNLTKVAYADQDSEWGYGGPEEGIPKEDTLIYTAGAFTSTDGPSESQSIFQGTQIIILGDTAIVAPGSPLSNILRERNGIIKYKVQEGDTISEIAATFGISLETIRWANSVRSFIRVGQELTILPVSGIIHDVRPGDSLESIASRYRINPDLIKKYNPDHQKLFDEPSSVVILPYAKPLKYTAGNAPSNLPNLNHYFALPARGWNWGELHHDNAIDIADQCGSPIYASAEGLVIEESGQGYWNGGYGNYVLVEHPNGTKTKYAHNKRNLIRIGDYVAQGDKIALIGNTGKTHGGGNGCHLHFEVEGAQNPFALR
jgi:LysM repeat protein